MTGLTRLTVIILFIAFYYDNNVKAQTTTQVVSINSTTISDNADNVRFDFKAIYSPKFGGTIEINATLFNDNSDTIYFLSSTCDGTQYSLQYDTTKLILFPFSKCYSSDPVLLKIPPNDKYDFRSRFKYNEQVTSIKLGFDFYRVGKSFDLTQLKLYNIHFRPDKNVIWAADKLIE